MESTRTGDDKWFVDHFLGYADHDMVATDYLTINAVPLLTDEEFDRVVRNVERVVRENEGMRPETQGGRRHAVWSLFLAQLHELRRTGSTAIRNNAWK